MKKKNEVQELENMPSSLQSPLSFECCILICLNIQADIKYVCKDNKDHSKDHSLPFVFV